MGAETHDQSTLNPTAPDSPTPPATDGLGTPLSGHGTVEVETTESLDAVVARLTGNSSASALIRAIHEHSIVSITDANGIILHVNPRFCEISGYTPQELIGHTHRVIKSGIHDQAFYKEMWARLLNGETWNGTFKNRSKNGSFFWVQTTIAPLMMEGDDKPVGYLSILTDISERFRMVTALDALARIPLDEYLYFNLAKILARALSVRWTALAVLTDSDTRLQVLGSCRDGSQGELLEFQVAGTPSETAMIRPVMIGQDVAKQYPKVRMLSRMGAESFRAEPLIDEKNNVIGLLFAVDDKPCTANPSEQALLHTIARRASLELQRQRSSNYLVKSQKQLRAVLDNSPLYISITDAEGRLQLINKPLAEVFGQKASDLEHKLWYEQAGSLEEATRARLRDSIDNALSNRKPQRLLLNTGDSSQLTYLDTHHIPLQDPVSKEWQVLSITNNVTELESARRAQANLVQTLRTLSRAHSAVIHADNEAQLLHDVCRVIAEEVDYCLVAVGYPLNDKEKTIQVQAGAGATTGFLEGLQFSWGDGPYGQGLSGRCVRERKLQISQNIYEDEAIAPWWEAGYMMGIQAMVSLPLLDEDDVIGVLTICSADPSGFAPDEVDMLTELANDLAFGIRHLRADRKMATLQRQLQQSEKMQALGQLTAGIAHDFNNILASILGYGDLALMRLEADKPIPKTYVQEIYNAGERARDLIAQMLSFSRSEESDSAFSIDPVPLIKETLRMLRASVPANIAFDIQLPEQGNLRVNYSPSELQQILMNLVINAKDAMPNGGALLVSLGDSVVSVEEECASCHHPISNHFLELQVMDTGTGIPPDALDKIFDPFFTTKPVGSGTGLGLSVVHGILHRRGGHLLIESSPGAGSCFRILLPNHAVANLAGTASSAAKDQDDSLLCERRICIVDDEHSVTEFLKDWLSSVRAEVRVFNDSQQALRHLASDADRYDLLITDMTMPSPTGLEIIQTLRQQGHGLPALLISGYGAKGEAALAQDRYSRFLAKPFRREDLLHLAGELLPPKSHD